MIRQFFSGPLLKEPQCAVSSETEVDRTIPNLGMTQIHRMGLLLQYIYRAAWNADAAMRILSVRLFVRPSNAQIVTKRKKN